MTRDSVRGLDARPGNEVGLCGFRGSFAEATVMATRHETNHLGATYAFLLVALHGAPEVTVVDTRTVVLVGPERPADRAWCPECRRRVDVEEASAESDYRGAHEVGYWVERLSCGHENSHETGVIGASPGGESLAEAVAQGQLRARQERRTAAEEAWG